jgi:hypothetical protein
VFGCSVAELGERITAEEFGHWWALYLQEPWAEARADIAAGMIAATLANVNRGRDTPPFKPLDFAPYLHPRDTASKEAAPAQFLKTLTKKGRPRG